MTSLRAFLTDDHRHCDDLLAIAEEAIAATNFELANRTFARFVNAMQAHFSAEERVLFPTFEAKTGIVSGPTQVMRLEHSQMRALLNAAVDALVAGEMDEYHGQVETLIIMMQQHNMKEENILYPMCEQQLDAEWVDLHPLLQQELAKG